jgi:hypothetical protein
MNDDQLRAHLDRRANTAKAPDLLPAVRSAIDTRQAPVPASRFAPFAGLVGIGAALLLLVVALPRLAPGDAPADGPVSAIERSGDFTLTITVSRSEYTEGEPIEVDAAFTYDGPQGLIEVTGATSLLGFRIEQQDGEIRNGPTWEKACNRYEMKAGVPVVVDFTKSGGYSNSAPDADFWRNYFSDPLLRLPPGIWRIFAIAQFGQQGCGSETELAASIVINVRSVASDTHAPSLQPSVMTPPIATPQVAPTSLVSTISCPPVQASLGDAAPTVIDETGLVERCLSATRSDGAPVTNPGGDLSVLQVEWSGSSCDAVATIRLRGSAGAYELEITPSSGPCLMLRAPYSIQLELREPIAAEDVQVTRGEPAEAGPAWWELAAHERPTAESTELDLVVFEQACANGESPEGRIVGPEISYSEDAVTITFSVTPLPGGGDCPLAPGAPVTVTLAEPLGDRKLFDGGFAADTEVVTEHAPGLLALSSSRVDTMAFERLAAMLGDGQCVAGSIIDRYVPTQEELEAAVDDLDGEEGLIDFDGYVTENWLSAARAFGAIEAYAGRPKPWYIVRTIQDSYWITSLGPTQVSGRSVWFLGDSSFTFVSCPDGPMTPAPDVSVETIECSGARQPGAVSIEDHTGRVRGCEVSSAEPPEAAEMASTTDPPALTMTWSAPCASDVHLTRLELWHRPPEAAPFDPMRFKPRFLLIADRLDPTDSSEGCLTAISGRQVRLELEQPIDASDVELFFTHDGRGTDTAVISEGEHQFELSIEADKPEYIAGEPIEVSGALLSVGDVTLSGHVGPMFGIEQLDGDIRHYPGPFVAMCPPSVTMDGGVPRSRDVTHPQGAGPDGDSDDEYFVDGHLRLPAGTYRIFAMSSFSIGETCTGNQLTLEASTVIRVR